MAEINKTLPQHLKLERNELAATVSDIKDDNFGAKDNLGSSRPSALKDKEKSKLESALMAMPEFKSALDVYRTLI